MKLIDISRTLSPEIATWPGDTRFNIIPQAQLAQGDSVNLTTLTLSAHTGTHVDAPWHFSSNGRTLEQLDLTPFWGKVMVVSVSKTKGALYPKDFSTLDFQDITRLLVHSSASGRDTSVFYHEFVYPSPELADFLGSQGVILYGTDAVSMDAADSNNLPGHKALLKNGISILEGLELQGVPDGTYELSALPLKIEGGDGSPVRAVLKTL